jgi:hypothetical protein
MSALDNLSDNAKAILGAVLIFAFSAVGAALLAEFFGVLR